MSIIIEQTQAELQSSHALSSRAEILDVRTASASFSSSRRFPSDPDDASLAIGVRFAPVNAEIESGRLCATTLFECVVTDSEESNQSDPFARFECSLTASYELNEAYTPIHDEISAFHRANIIFNSWPFFREFVQSAASRMNIPAPPIPFLRVQIIPAGEKETQRALNQPVAEKPGSL